MSFIASIAGTPVDSEMGRRVLEAHGLHGKAYPLSANPREQTKFQNSPMEEKIGAMETLLRRVREQGCDQVFVYCNSLAAAVDFHPLAEGLGLGCVTPLDIYTDMAKQHRRLVVFTANAQSSAGIEKVMLEANPKIDITCIDFLNLVEAIEAMRPPKEIVKDFGLAKAADWFLDWGAQAIVLACTHFPYIKEAFCAVSPLPVLDPAEDMVARLKGL